MGMLVDGKWQTRNEVWGDETGRFRRTETQFRNWVTADGSPGPRGDGGFAAAPGRYHLYVSLPARGPTAPSSCGRSKASRTWCRCRSCTG
jgi:glutathionyl-hydroquinone reductase